MAFFDGDRGLCLRCGAMVDDGSMPPIQTIKKCSLYAPKGKK